MRVLVIATHADDEVLGCGGVMARHAAQGDELHLLIVTRGVPDLFPPELVDAIFGEMRAASEILGVHHVHCLDFPAPRLDVTPGHKVADAIGSVIRTVEPRVVYLPHRGDIHADHRAVYTATLVAARPLPGGPVQKLLSYETLSETEWAPPAADDAFVPTVFVDIEPYLELKLQAAACYEIQLRPPPHPRSLEAVEAQARLRGSAAGLAAAEAFMLVREIVD
jgi:LmbE family N-acetylglucosaminyl deacetylase